MVLIYEFCKIFFLIQQPGELREHHLDNVRPKINKLYISAIYLSIILILVYIYCIYLQVL